ncbi:MAG: hypothetical protein J7L99_02045, partial [Planctomycetes bacterium]|nr:hypothetical protein [Planctomycetota bacterium]
FYPQAATIIDLKNDKEAFNVHLQKFLTRLGKNVKLTQITFGNVSYHSFDTPAGPCAIGFVGKIFFASIGKGVPMKIAETINGKAKSLASQKKFANAMKELCSENVQIAAFIDAKRLIKKVETIINAQGKRGKNARLSKDTIVFRNVIKALGLDGVTVVAGASNIVDRGFHEKIRIFSPSPHRGILSIFAEKPLPAGALESVPADADVLLAANFNPIKLLSLMRNIAAAIEPDSKKEFDESLIEINKTLGVDIEKDLLKYTSGQWTIVSAPSLGGMITGTVITVNLTDADKFLDAITRIEKKLLELIDQPRTKVRVYRSNGVVIHYLIRRSDDFPLPVAPAWAVHKGKFYLAAFPQVIESAVSGTNEKPITKSATFIAFRKRLSPNVSYIEYWNTPSIKQKLYGCVLIGGTAATNFLGRFAPEIRPEILPALPKVEKYIWPTIAAISSDANGITIESYSSVPTLLISTAYSGTAVSIMLPAMFEARINTRRVASMINLKSIGVGLAVYATENNDDYPPDLNRLVKEKIIDAEMLMSPTSGRKVHFDSKSNPIPPFDYVYLGAGLKTTDIPRPSRFILAYEKPEINRFRGTNVLYADGHVEWVFMKKFQHDLARTRQWIEKHKKRKRK